MAQLNSVGYQVNRGVGAAAHKGGLERLTRIGIACKGVVYLLVGVLALMAAFQNGGETTDKEGVIQRIASQPFGDFALAIIAVGLMAYALWRFVCCFMDTEREGSSAKGSAKRVFYAISGFVYASASIYAFRLLMGSGAQSGGGSQTWSARLMRAPGGELILALIGVVVIVAGIYQIRGGLQEKFREHLGMGSGNAGNKHWVIRAGKWGYVARGIVFCTMGILVILAAMRSDAGQVKGLEGSLDALAAQPFGQWLLAFVAAGLVCYGLYSLVEARYRRVSFQ